MPRVEPIVDEYQLHRLACPDCKITTFATLPPGVTRGHFGPYLQAVLSIFTDSYRLSKREVQQLSADLYELVISIDRIAKLERRSNTVLEAPDTELTVAVASAKAAKIDETSCQEDRKKARLWTIVTQFFTVFGIARHRSGDVAHAWLGSQPEQVVGNDWFRAFSWTAARWWQLCWAHLGRDFQTNIEQGGDVKQIVERLVKQSHQLFHNWHRVRDGTRNRKAVGHRMARLSREVRQTLKEGSNCGCLMTSVECFES